MHAAAPMCGLGSKQHRRAVLHMVVASFGGPFTYQSNMSRSGEDDDDMDDDGKKGKSRWANFETTYMELMANNFPGVFDKFRLNLSHSLARSRGCLFCNQCSMPATTDAYVSRLLIVLSHRFGFDA